MAKHGLGRIDMMMYSSMGRCSIECKGFEGCNNIAARPKYHIVSAFSISVFKSRSDGQSTVSDRMTLSCHVMLFLLRP